MALSESVEASLKEAEQSLRNALAFAARQERPMVCSTIADMIGKIESVIHTDVILDTIEKHGHFDWNTSEVAYVHDT